MYRHMICNASASVLLMAVCAGPACAQADTSDSSSVEQDDKTIIVTGKRTDAESVRRESGLFTRKVGAVPVAGQIARWNEPVCPKVIGVDAKISGIVIDRIKSVARQVGAPLPKAVCKPNLVVTFTPDANGLVAAILKRDSRAISATVPGEAQAIRASTKPVLWWYGSHTEAADGHQITGLQSPALFGNNLPSAGDNQFLNLYSSSLIDSQLRVNIASATVLVDVTRAEGRKLNSVAAYVAFVSLARIRFTASFSGAPSILGLFSNGPEAATDLTDWDTAYLTALYHVPVNRPADIQRSLISNEMAKLLTK